MTRARKLAFVFLICIASAAVGPLTSGQSKDQPGPPARPSGTEQPVPQRVRVSQGVSQGLRVKWVAPKYPEKARQDGIQGKVVLRANISKEGDVVDLSAISGDPLLVKSAVKAVKQWKYKPYLLQGNPVEVDTEIVVNFSLSH